MTNSKLKSKSRIKKSTNNKKYDLKDRTFKYVIGVLDYLDKLPRSRVNKVVVDQCTRSVTSIGANYEEADSAHTKKDFAYKMEIMRKEAKETRFWLKVSRVKNPSTNPDECEKLRDEGLQLIRIFTTIINKSKK